MTTLRESMDRSKRGGAGRRGGASSPNGGSVRKSGRDLGSLSRTELDKRAKKAGIEGRSKMTKAELARPLEPAA
jgi:DNA end-binding protein Ku